ncbi:MAG: hypothetical protein L6V85_07025 [Clostridiales bacterium]|nr:MAG: hypothetical protein L6V85_07025 [Clostridiales bacterium]
MFIAALSSELSEKMAIGGKLTLMGILIVFGLLCAYRRYSYSYGKNNAKIGRKTQKRAQKS